MLDEGTDGGSSYLAIMHLSLLARFVASQTLGAIDDCVHGHIDAVLGKAIA